MVINISAADLLAAVLADLQTDPFDAVRKATQRHRAEHGCGAYTYDKGPFLSALSRKLQPAMVLEMGTALGYTSLCLSQGGSDTHVLTIEADAAHVSLARRMIDQHTRSNRIEVLHGRFEVVLPKLGDAQDLIFFDGFAPDLDIYGQILRLSHKGTVLVSANLGLEIDDGHTYRAALHDTGSWDTAYVDQTRETALSVKL
jgi:predicted O-methyltransferase YrrM